MSKCTKNKRISAYFRWPIISHFDEHDQRIGTNKLTFMVIKF